MTVSQMLFRGATGNLRRESTIHMPNQQTAANDAATCLLLSAHISCHGILYLGPFLLTHFILFPGYVGPQGSSKNVRDKSSEREVKRKGISLPLSWRRIATACSMRWRRCGRKIIFLPGFFLSGDVHLLCRSVFPEYFPTLSYRVTLCPIHPQTFC